MRVTNAAIYRGEDYWLWLVDTTCWWKSPVIHQATIPSLVGTKEQAQVTFITLDIPLDDYLDRLDATEEVVESNDTGQLDLDLGRLRKTLDMRASARYTIPRYDFTFSPHGGVSDAESRVYGRLLYW